jgi:hypothetical protein
MALIIVSLGFFEDVYILPGHLPPNSAECRPVPVVVEVTARREDEE